MVNCKTCHDILWFDITHTVPFFVLGKNSMPICTMALYSVYVTPFNVS